MKIMKFGGTSVGRPERMHQVKDLVTSSAEPTIVVLSALSGTTNALTSIGEALASGDKLLAKERIDELHAHYLDFYPKLLSTEAGNQKAEAIVRHYSMMLTIRVVVRLTMLMSKELSLLLVTLSITTT